MYNMLIVDDEYNIRHGLTLLEWDKWGINIAGLCSNGLEAYEKISQGGIDIVLTDIKMPMMDGIELAKIIHEKFFNIPVIALSGYNEFEYAQQMMSYHVVGYLLKPIELDKLVELLDRVKQLLDKRNRESIEIDKLRKQNIEMLKQSRNRFLKDLTEREITDEELECAKSFFVDDIFNFKYGVSAIFTFDSLDAVKNLSLSSIKTAVEFNLEKYFAQNQNGYFYVDKMLNIYTFLATEKETSNEHLKVKLEDIRGVLNSLTLAVKSTISCRCGLIADIHKLYMSVKNAMELSVDDDESGWITFYTETDPEDSNEQNILINAAIDYIHNNYNKNIALTDVAKYLGINSTYFSYLFKKVQKVSFIEYVTSYRIEMAKIYLKNAKYRIGEVASLVGYDNPKYFSHIFKTGTGMTPHEYRKRGFK